MLGIPRRSIARSLSDLNERKRERIRGGDAGRRSRRFAVWKTRTLLPIAALAAMMGCASQQQQLISRQPAATNTALQRARFDMNCPQANATILSQDFIQPAVQGPWVEGMTRLEYTIGIDGCGQRRTYVIMCQEGTQTCFAAGSPGSRLGGMEEPQAPMPNPDMPSPPAAHSVPTACKADIKRFCSEVPPGEGRIKACMKAHLPELSEECKEALFQAWLHD